MKGTRNNRKPRLTLDRPATYQIKVPGHLNESWQDWAWEITITHQSQQEGLPVTLLTGVFDQAALLGLLRQLYSMGVPLISAVCLDAC